MDCDNGCKVLLRSGTVVMPKHICRGGSTVLLGMSCLLLGCQSRAEDNLPSNRAAAAGVAGAAPVAWPAYGGDLGSSRYSSLTDLNPETVRRLAPAWQWRTGDKLIRNSSGAILEHLGWFEATPVVLGDTLYVPTAFSQVVALEVDTGRELWRFDPEVYRWPVVGAQGFVHRGVAIWSGPSQRRVLINAGWRLFALDAASGRPIQSFGAGGSVDLTAGLRWPVDVHHYRSTSPPAVFENLVIVGSSVHDGLIYERDPPGDVQAFDALTGRRVWVWSPIPAPGEPGSETWEGRSGETTGHANVWAPLTVDTARGLVFLPVSTPSNDFYGGARLGDNLFAESIVCLDARTGVRRWHYQIVHHGLWDYDPAAAPVLVTLRKEGRTVDAVALAGKTGFLYVFDRETGAPVWPIEERPVSASDVPGERAARTQPFPTWPRPFSPQGFGPDDLMDFTPALREAALAFLARHRGGPLFTPPSVQGTLVRPGIRGGAGWGSVAYDPANRILYVKSTNLPSLIRLEPGVGSPTKVGRFTGDPEIVGRRVEIPRPGERGGLGDDDRASGIPINKPPYGTLTAIPLDTGEQLWQVPLGDTPALRNHPALKGIALPPLGVAGPLGPIVTAGGLLFATGGSATLYALDTRNGAVLWQHALGAPGRSVPMTFRSRKGLQYVVVAVGRTDARLMAFTLKPELPARPAAP
jgi:glucose dehydrogenase